MQEIVQKLTAHRRKNMSFFLLYSAIYNAGNIQSIIDYSST